MTNSSRRALAAANNGARPKPPNAPRPEPPPDPAAVMNQLAVEGRGLYDAFRLRGCPDALAAALAAALVVEPARRGYRPVPVALRNDAALDADAVEQAQEEAG